MTNLEKPATQSFSRHSTRDAESGVWTRYYTAGPLDEAIKAVLQSKSELLRPIPCEGKTVVIDPIKGVDPETIASAGGTVMSFTDIPDMVFDPLRFGK